MLNESILSKNKKYIVGVSGGPDSMALLDMLIKENYNVIVAHVNYKTRDESDSEEQLVKDNVLYIMLSVMSHILIITTKVHLKMQLENLDMHSLQIFIKKKNVMHYLLLIIKMMY